MDRDRDHLELPAVFHYAIAVFGAPFSMLPLVHLGYGQPAAPAAAGASAPPSPS